MKFTPCHHLAGPKLDTRSREDVSIIIIFLFSSLAPHSLCTFAYAKCTTAGVSAVMNVCQVSKWLEAHDLKQLVSPFLKAEVLLLYSCFPVHSLVTCVPSLRVWQVDGKALHAQAIMWKANKIGSCPPIHTSPPLWTYLLVFLNSVR